MENWGPAGQLPPVVHSCLRSLTPAFWPDTNPFNLNEHIVSLHSSLSLFSFLYPRIFFLLCTLFCYAHILIRSCFKVIYIELRYTFLTLCSNYINFFFNLLTYSLNVFLHYIYLWTWWNRLFFLCLVNWVDI